MAEKPAVYFYDANGEDQLREAAEQGNVEEAEALLKQDINPSSADMVSLNYLSCSRQQYCPQDTISLFHFWVCI